MTGIDGTVYVGSFDGTLYAVDGATGTQEWAFTQPSDAVVSSPTVVDGTVYVGSYDETLYAVDAVTGSQEWAFTQPSSSIDSSPTVVDGTVYVGSSDETLYAVDAVTGTQEWAFTQPSDWVASSPTVVDGTVYVGSHDETLYAVGAGTGTQQWTFTQPSGAIYSSPTEYEGTVYVGSGSYGSDDGTLYAVDGATGTQEWAFTQPSDRVESSPTVVDGTIYVGVVDGAAIGSHDQANAHGALYAVDAGTGTQEWAFTQPSDAVESSPTVVDGTVYVGSWDATLYAVDATTGEQEWAFTQPSGSVRSSPTVYEGTIYVGSKDATLYAVDGATGSQEWAFTQPSDWVRSSPTVVADPENWDSVGSRVLLGTLGHHHDLRAENTPQMVTDSLDSLAEQLDTAANQLEANPETTLTHLNEIESDLDDVAEQMAGGGFHETTQRLKRLRGQCDDLRERARAQRDAREGAIEDLDRTEGTLDDAAAALDGGRLDDAFDHLDDALAALADTSDAIEDHEFPDLAKRVDHLEERHGDLRDRAATRRETRGQATDALDSAENALDAAANRLDSDAPRRTLSHLDGVGEALDTASEAIDDHGFLDLADRLATLEERHERLQQEAENALTRIPATIPTTPRRSLSYDAIEKGDPIGSGGNADVYRATAATVDGDIKIALKEPRMSGTLHTEVVERMMEEAETWQQLDDHDHIVGVVDYGSEPLPWIAMEYMDAGHLGERMDNLPFEQALWTAIATTQGIRHAHRRGVAHLDLKPENILFRSGEGWDAPKVADWGLSKHLLEHSKSVEGLSPHYAAPEQFDDSYGSTDDITDIYQLGAVFYELFTGQPPFEGSPARVMNQVLTEDPAPPSTVADVPEQLDRVLLTAMAKEKTDRYESVLYLRDDLQDLSEKFA